MQLAAQITEHVRAGNQSEKPILVQNKSDKAAIQYAIEPLDVLAGGNGLKPAAHGGSDR